MRYTKPTYSQYFAALTVILCGLISSAAISCANDDEPRGFVEADSGTAPKDSGVDEAMAPTDGAGRDAAPFDPTALSIECASPSCATALTSRASGDAQSFCALLRDGTVACWGANNEGQLGRGNDAGTLGSAIPIRVSDLSNIVALERTCAVDRDGAVYCWGKGPFMNGGTAVTTEQTPVKLPISHARKVSVGEEVGCALLDDEVVCWGYNADEQVARFDGTNRDVSLPPSPVSLSFAAKARDISVGKASFAILEDGSIVSWGATPPAGRLTSREPDGLPQQLAIQGITTAVSVDVDNACAAASGIGYCWGAGSPNTRYTDLSRALPTPIVAPEPIRQVSTTRQRRTTYEAFNPAESITVAMPHRWCAVSVSGNVYCWGYNATGQAGDGTNDYAYETVKAVGLPAPAVKVEASFDSTCALLVNGKVYCWGGNYYGQLGDGKFRIVSLSPQEVLLP